MPDARYDVVAVGNAIVDVLAHTPADFPAQHGLVKDVMQLVDADVSHRLYEAMPAATEISGGSAANTVVGVASFGGRSAFIGKVRDDQLGEVFAHDIRAAGVAFDVLPAADGPATARCLVMVTPDAHRTMSTYLGASGNVGPGDVSADVVGASSVTYLEGYLWDAEIAKAAMLRAIELAVDAGRKVALTLSDPFCVDRHRKEFLGLLDEHVDILFANESEIVSLFEVSEFDEALQATRRHRCEYAALTRGPRGSVIVHGDEVHVIDPYPVPAVVDTTGAGDLYAAGVLYALATDRDAAAAGHLGSLAAAEVISHLGARPERPLRDLAAEAGLL